MHENMRNQHNAILSLCPTHQRYGSSQGQYSWALHVGLISRQEYDAAKSYYGSTWNYCGD